MFIDPLNFLWNNKVYLGNETLLDIKELDMDELDVLDNKLGEYLEANYKD